jgi:purine-binding chemotaxis protein CheW
VEVDQTEMGEATEDTMHGRFLTFAIEREVFGIEIRVVREIIGMQPINTLPEVPAYIRGIINLRGRIIPVIDMRLKLRKEEAEYTDRTCIIVIETQRISAGLIVDQVDEVLSIGEENISPPPELGKAISHRYVNGIGKVDGDVKLLLDCEKLFNSNESDLLTQIHDKETEDAHL